MKIAILGTRGIPNNYGGFEQFAEHLAVALVKRKHEVTVYNSHNHSYKEDYYNGVRIKHIYDPEDKIGTIGQLIYDFLSIIDTRKEKYDVILQLGYTSSSVFFKLHPKDSIIVTNMDGLEWKRTKYSKKVQMFLKWAESLAVKRSDYLVSDSVGIQNYLKKKYNIESTYIPYGSDVFKNPDDKVIKKFNLTQFNYNMLIARIEPENSIEMILEGVCLSQKNMKFLVIGNINTSYGEYITNKFSKYLNIIFTGAIYDINILNNLRYYSNLYFHGHTVGGTNPSLLEAMGSSALICANKNEFNESILDEDAFYFQNKKDVAIIINSIVKEKYLHKVENNLIKIEKLYQWDKIIDSYERLFLDIKYSSRIK
ncbi:DUF1972 domain-containing protein [Sulfurimonas autotrophica]|uniref:DUF1972 domain-containing protein n=1 Tax=Sulfurimonas autotrophica (strain ATCC BAA-671 / DSM 16294 / JCM 11897 / OK10) TaxID=563040 RepID=E0UU26_SULAO|nr:DUF1972 domain-containing protein [Sulfurimonas autotrophica]ADN08335.1 Protein of unknown function DUF1972 [Sulfurimonas autotrophica DSM 16294]